MIGQVGEEKGPTSTLSTSQPPSNARGSNPSTDLLSAAPSLVFFFRPPSFSQRFQVNCRPPTTTSLFRPLSLSLVRAHLLLLSLLFSRSSFNSRWPTAQPNHHGQPLLPPSKRRRTSPTSTPRRTVPQLLRPLDQGNRSSPSRPSPSMMFSLRESRDLLTTEEYPGLQRSY